MIAESYAVSRLVGAGSVYVDDWVELRIVRLSE